MDFSVGTTLRLTLSACWFLRLRDTPGLICHVGQFREISTQTGAILLSQKKKRTTIF